MKLNIGAGLTVIEGYTPIDRKFGGEALPLTFNDGTPVPDECADDIRAAHILEHFTFREARDAMKEWTRVLKPGGRIRIAVPDVDKVLASEDRKKRLFWLMGGQMNENDIHKSAYDRQRLMSMMHESGLEEIKDWVSPNTDTAALPISLNLEGRKKIVAAPPAPAAPEPEQVAETEQATITLAAYLTLPRYEAVVSRGIIENALKALKISLTTSQGVFWGQCMQRMFEKAVADGVDWILSVDSDSLFTATQLSLLLDTLASNPHIDALAALQCKRGAMDPLFTTGEACGPRSMEVTGSPIKVLTAHFGLTLFRVDALKEVEKPWFKSQPCKDGTWGDERMDDDIWFWHQWRKAGKTIYVAPKVSIGHLEETVVMFNEQMQPEHMYVGQWREQHLT